MRVSIQVPDDAVPERNPLLSLELPAVPRVGDFVDCHGIDGRLVVVSVAWEVAFSSSFVDVGSGPYVTCGWEYPTEELGQ